MDNTEKALQVLIDAEIKETDFKNEAIYNTIVGNFKKCFENVAKLNNAIYEKNTLIFDLQNQIQRRDIMVSDLDGQITELKAENEKMKVGLFARNQTIQTLEKEADERRADNEDLEKENDNLMGALSKHEAVIFSLEQQLEERNVSIQALEKVNELITCLKDAAIVCKEKNELKSGDASYWLGAENAYLQVVKSVKREFNID